MRDDIKIEYIGIKPSDSIRSFLSMVARQIRSSAPSDSFFRVTVEKNQNIFHIVGVLESSKKSFQSNIKSDGIESAVLFLRKDLVDKIDQWKSKRDLSST